MEASPKRYWTAIVDGIILTVILYYISDKLRWPLLFEKTVTAGGDMASHYPTAVYLKNILLPQGRLIGWYPGNFCGFPLFQFYFPLPFISIVLLSTAIPMTISFKLVSVMGIYLIPLCSYISMRIARQRFPVPVLAAIFSLAFLFSEGNSMWGGNFLSNLAGEFSFQISFALSIGFLFSVYRNIDKARYVAVNGLFLGIIGLCHGVGLIFSVLVPSFFLISPMKGLGKKLLYLLRVYGLALGFMAFWFLPFLAGSKWSTKFNLLWDISGIQEIFPEILWPFLIISAAGTIGIVICRIFKRKNPDPALSEVFRLVLYLWWAMGIAVVLFETAYELNVVDIRFLPYAEYLPMLLAAVTVGYASRFFKGRVILVLILLLASGVWIDRHEKSVTAWAKWNYEGFENKRTWDTFSEINDFLSGNENDPRVVYEHSPLNNRFGSVRAFENLPYFSGRATLEGLYMQSSITTPFAYYLQSEISSPGSFPLPQYDYSSPNLDMAVRHFHLFNINRFITVSDTMKSLAQANPDLKKTAAFGDVEIYSLTSSRDQYVEPLLKKPVTKEQSAWRTHAYQWFQKYDASFPFVVYTSSKDSRIPEINDLSAFTTWDNLPDEQYPGPLPEVSSRLLGGTIHIRTSEIGRPLLVKVSYHPNWRCTGALGPFLISPSLMMIIPTENDVHMVFGRGAADHAGLAITLITILLCLFRNLGPTRFMLYADPGDLSPRISFQKRRIAVILCWAAAVGMLSAYVLHKRVNSPVRLRQKAMQHYAAGELDPAIRMFKKILSLSDNAGYGDDAAYFLGLSYWRNKDYGNAAATFSILAADYPESRFIPEVLYHLVMCRTFLDDRDGAAKAYVHLSQQFPGNAWTNLATDFVAEHGEAAP